MEVTYFLPLPRGCNASRSPWRGDDGGGVEERKRGSREVITKKP